MKLPSALKEHMNQMVNELSAKLYEDQQDIELAKAIFDRIYQPNQALVTETHEIRIISQVRYLQRLYQNPDEASHLSAISSNDEALKKFRDKMKSAADKAFDVLDNLQQKKPRITEPNTPQVSAQAHNAPSSNSNQQGVYFNTPQISAQTHNTPSSNDCVRVNGTTIEIQGDEGQWKSFTLREIDPNCLRNLKKFDSAKRKLTILLLELSSVYDKKYKSNLLDSIVFDVQETVSTFPDLRYRKNSNAELEIYSEGVSIIINYRCIDYNFESTLKINNHSFSFIDTSRKNFWDITWVMNAAVKLNLQEREQLASAMDEQTNFDSFVRALSKFRSYRGWVHK